MPRPANPDAAPPPVHLVLTTGHPSGVSNPPSASQSLLSGFAAQEAWSAIQDSLYVVLSHGPYQRRVLTCGVLSAVGVLLYSMSYSLLGRHVDHWCRPPYHVPGLSTAEWKNLSIPVEDDGSLSKCTMYHPPFSDGQRNDSTVVPCYQWDYDIANGKDSIVSKFNLVCDRRYMYDLSFIAAILGTALLSPLAGFVSDQIGRKPVVMVCAFTWLIAAVGNSVAETYAMFVVSRVLAYAAANATFTLTFIVLFEVTGNAKRWLFTILDTAVAGTLVPPFVHVISGMEPRWELSQGIFVVATAMAVVWCCLLNESPAWLLATVDVKRAQAGALVAAAVNGEDVAKAKAAFLVIISQMQRMGHSHMLTTGSTSAQDRIFRLLTTPREAASAFFARFVLNAVYFGLMLTDEVSGPSLQLATVLVSTAYYGVICWAVSNYGLKNVVVGLLIVVFTFAATEVLAILLRSEDAHTITDAGMKVAVSGAGSVVLFYTAEIFPTDRRSEGISMALFFGSSGTLCAIFIRRLSGAHSNLGFRIFAGFMVLLSVAAVRWLPEILVEKRSKKTTGTVSEQERKDILVASLGTRHKNASLMTNTESTYGHLEPTVPPSTPTPLSSEKSSWSSSKSLERLPLPKSRPSHAVSRKHS